MKSLSFRLLLPALLGAGLSAHAQYVGEAVYYSRLQFGGPARTQGIAGANVALGADFGNLSSNPAGLGLFRKSEFNFSPGVGLGTADASGTGTALSETKNSFHIASLGAVFTTRLADDDASSDWRGGSFALGFSRLADYNTAFRYSGTVADDKSLFQYLREPAQYGRRTGNPAGNDYPGNPNGSDYQNGVADIQYQFDKGTYFSLDGLAYGTYLTDTTYNGRTGLATLVTRLRKGPIVQGETVTTSGSVSQFDFGYGGSYKNRLFVGGALGIVSSNRRTVRDFSESESSLDTYFSSLALHDEVKTTSTGFNVRLGIIYRASDVLRVGASVQSPTYFQLTDTYSTSLTTNFSPAFPTVDANNRPIDVTTATLTTAPGIYDYALLSPFRANGGVALTFGKIGFVTADAEYVGYGQARFSSNPESDNGDDKSFAGENEAIKATYQNALNVRLGAEARFGIFRLRGGYAHYGDPYRNSTVERTQEFYTGGLGFRSNDFFLDFAGVYTTYTQLYSPYTLESEQQPVINVSAKRYTTTVTAGFTF